MRSFFLAATLFASVFATDPNSCSSATSASPSEITTVKVTVGGPNGTLKYFPEDIQVAPGNIVQFEFMPKNHTVTESSFADPCVPLAANLTRENRPGVRSGFVPTNGTGDQIPAFRILVNDTKPIWLFCGQKSPKPHCQAGMVMVINQNRTDTEKTLEAYRAKAMALAGTNSTSSASTTVASSTTTTPPASVVTPPAQTTPISSGPALSASSTVTSSASVGVFTGAAAPTGQPVRLAALGGLAVVAVAIL